jgi:hypothetical protein
VYVNVSDLTMLHWTDVMRILLQDTVERSIP